MNGMGDAPCVVGQLDANGNTIAYCPPTNITPVDAAAMQMAADASYAAMLAGAMQPQPQPQTASWVPYVAVGVGLLILASLFRR